MTVSTNPSPNQEARWPAVVALFAIVGLRLALPRSLAASPAWVPLALVTLLVIPTVLARRMERHRLNRWLGFVITGIVTIDMIWSLSLLVAAIIAHKLQPAQLLLSAVVLWASNILVFASWYWRLDAGGPNARDRRAVHSEGAFLFPQMTLDASDPDSPANGWSPGFVDYLFLAFNTSTAFSPTDVPVLSRWAKLLMMVQSIISLATIALLAGRAVNIL
jgi:branched-subunit amino acid transport protein